jgi:perosamine synthetase
LKGGKGVIPLFEPWLGEEELAQITEVIKSKWIAEGEKTRELEKKIAALCGVKHAVAVSNGTVALHVALKLLGVGEGDEVIVPDFTFIASANSVKLTGATPVFVDVDDKTFNIDPESAQRAITKRTKAIMPVHIYGQAADMNRIGELARKYDLYIVEDAAQGIGVKFNGKPVGGFGDIGCISFYADKTMTTGEGGMVLTNDDELAEQCILMKNQGRLRAGAYIHPHIGYNFRLSDLQAAIGLAQLSKLAIMIEMKKTNEKLYRDGLIDVKGVEFPYIDPRVYNVPFRINILVDDPEGLQKSLEKEGIGSRRFFYPLHRQPCYNLGGQYPNTEKAYARGLSLPSSVALSEPQIMYVCERVRSFVEGNGN